MPSISTKGDLIPIRQRVMGLAEPNYPLASMTFATSSTNSIVRRSSGPPAATPSSPKSTPSTTSFGPDNLTGTAAVPLARTIPSYPP